MTLNVDHLLRTAATREQAILAVQLTPDNDDVLYDLYRNAAIRSFGLSLETAGRLLRKALKAVGGSPDVDNLVFNDVLLHAGNHGLLEQEGVERWRLYHAHNHTAADHGVNPAQETLTLLPAYLADLRALALRLQEVLDAAA